MFDMKANETIEDLQFKGLKIILSADLPRFTTDSVLLSDFCKAKMGDFVADLAAERVLYRFGVWAILMLGCRV